MMLEIKKKSLYEEIRILYTLAKTEWLLKRQSSPTGLIVSLLNPAVTFLIAYLIYSDRGAGITQNFWLSIFISIIHWEFFTAITSQCLNSYIVKSSFLNSFNFNIITPVLCHFFAAVTSLSIEILLFILIVIFSINPTLEMFLTYLISLFVFSVFTLFTSILISVLRLYIQDLQYIWPIILRMLFIASPVLYEPMVLTEKYNFYLMINPLYHFINILKYSFQGDVYRPYFSVKYILGFTTILAIATTLTFNKLKYEIMKKL